MKGNTLSKIVAAAQAASTAVESVVKAAGEYTPATLITDLGEGALTVLPWIGAGVTGGITLMFAFMGIKKGLEFFRGVAK